MAQAPQPADAPAPDMFALLGTTPEAAMKLARKAYDDGIIDRATFVTTLSTIAVTVAPCLATPNPVKW